MRASLIACLALAACGGPRPADPGAADPAPPIDAPDAGAAVAVGIAPADAATATPDAAPDAMPDAAPAPTFAIPADPRPAVKGKTVTLQEGKAVTVGGVRVKFGQARHKHASRGGSLGMWGFELTRGKRRLEHELRSSDEGDWQAEVPVFGALLVFTHVSYSEFTVTAVAGKVKPPLDDDAAIALLEAAAASAGLPRGNSTGYQQENGIGELTASDHGGALWVAHVGLSTRRVWFTAPSRRDRD